MKVDYSFKFKPTATWEALRSQNIDSLEAVGVRLDLFRLSVLAGFDELLCLPVLIQVDKYWYQIETAKKVMRQFGGRALLADEVGLGKTIEAAMICKEYLTRGMIHSVLILTPASLVSQWQSELMHKFDIQTVTSEKITDAEQFWQNNDRIIVSLNVAKSKKHYELVTARHWDLVIVDEAHHLRNRNTLNWKLVNDIQKRFILMLTATPVQNTLIDLFNLLTVLKPGLLQTESHFRQEYVASRKARTPKNPEKLRHLMREVMVRNTRSLVDVKLPKRFASTIVVEPSEPERDLYKAIHQYIRKYKDEGIINKLTQSHLLRRAGSSIRALQESLKNLSVRVQHPEIQELLHSIESIQQVRKTEALFHLLEKATDKTKILVFVNYQDTHIDLAAYLTTKGIAFSEFHGGLSLKEKDRAIDLFRETVPVMLTSETGGEGRNIQFASTIVNYDLPWNPMKIEQRIGRLHRIGQTQDVFVFNFCIKDSIEAYILSVLHDKINMFELVVGEMDTILGHMENDFDFSEAVLDIWIKNQSEHELNLAFDNLANDLLQAKSSYCETKALDEEIFGEDFEA